MTRAAVTQGRLCHLTTGACQAAIRSGWLNSGPTTKASSVPRNDLQQASDLQKRVAGQDSWHALGEGRQKGVQAANACWVGVHANTQIMALWTRVWEQEWQVQHTATAKLAEPT